MKINLCSKIINYKSSQIPHTILKSTQIPHTILKSSQISHTILPGGGVTALQTGETSGRRCVISFLTEMMLIMLMILVMMMGDPFLRRETVKKLVKFRT